MAGKDASGRAPRLGTAQFTSLPFNAVFGVALVTLVALAVQALVTASAQAQQATPAAGPAFQASTANARPAAADTQKSPVMAVVNGEQITRQSLADECVRRYASDVLDSMISKQILLLACQSRGVTITDKDIEDEIRNVATKFSLSVDRWLALLESERNVDAQQYRKDIIWPTLALRRLAARQSAATPEELRAAFESEYGPKVKARLIVVSSRQKADWVLQAAQANPDSFAQLAKEHSEDPASASAYGVIPPIRKHVGDPNVEQAAFALKEGQLSPVIQVGNQYLVLKCERQIPETFISSAHLPQVEAQLKERLAEHKTRVQSAELFQQLQGQAKIVNVFKDAKLQPQYPGAAAVVNGQTITVRQLSEECLSRHGKDVLEGEINRLLLIQELRRVAKAVNEQDINREVARAAEAYNFLKKDGSPDVEAWLKSVTENDGTTVELYVRDAVWPSVALKKLVGESVEVTAEDLQKGFESNFGERVEVLAIVLGNQRQAQTVWDMARNNPTDQFFGELANQYSVEPSSRSNFGQVPPLRKHSGQPLLEKEAFRLKPGELSGIIAMGDKYVILRCLGRTQPIVKDFNAVKDELYRDILEKKMRLAMAKEFDRLKGTSQIDNFLAGTSQAGRLAGAKTASQASFEQPLAPAAKPAKR
ncbi:MAG: peptidylprolyl isomerase [Sedimentisphaerales bacterium]|nr:peptidylprolyl isomerase [Sedimentisphaerales bacterium]